MANQRKPDFSGWATKYGILCTDGRTILPGAFQGCDGKKVPLVWQHVHDDPDMVLGHCVMHDRKEGIWVDGYFNSNPKAMSAKEALRNSDYEALSIYANGLKHVNGKEVAHGNIKEVSLVLAGANMGATIQNVMLAHGDGMYDEMEDEAVIYGTDNPVLSHEDEDEEELSHADEGGQDDKTLKDIWDSMTEEQQNLCYFMIGEAAKGDAGDEDDEEDDEAAHADDEGEGADDSDKTLKDIWDSMTEEQQNLCYFMVGEAANGDAENEDDTAEHDDDEGEELTMKTNVFDRNKTAPADVLSHADQKKIIERGVKLGSMKEAWEEALETNETLSHDVFNDDGTKQTYGIANIDYLFPDYAELNDRPEMIRRNDDWVNVILNGVTKTPRARLRTTNANITMDEARAKGYTKGNPKEEEVFNLLRRTVDPQTIYKKQKFDRDDIIDIDSFDVIAWVKVEMRDMLNEEIARAILLGDGRSVSDPDKIFETHIKPIVNDDDLYTVKVEVTAGTDDAATAKNGIRALIKNRKHYKGSGNLVLFTSEDWLSEWLLLEDQFGHELYADETALARKMRVQRVVTVPLMDNLVVDGQQVMGIVVDLKDYVTGTNRRGQVEFFDDFDINFNQYKYLIETRLSGMLRKPYSAIVLKVGTASKGAPHYDEATVNAGDNPRDLGLYEKEGDVYRKTADAAPVTGKTYYERSTSKS